MRDSVTGIGASGARARSSTQSVAGSAARSRSPSVVGGQTASAGASMVRPSTNTIPSPSSTREFSSTSPWTGASTAAFTVSSKRVLSTVE